MTGSRILLFAVIIAALFGVVWMMSGDVETANTPETRFEVPVPGGSKEVPAQRQIPAEGQ
jgi:hypothetical protein